MIFPKKLEEKINQRIDNKIVRHLSSVNSHIDFSSNDYLGFAKSETIFKNTHEYLITNNYIQNGGMGSRLLSGNHPLYTITEDFLASFHKSESALIFNSGYDANIGLFSSVPQKGDLILFDELIHASIRDGIQLSHAKSYKFKHNDIAHLQRLLEKHTPDSTSAVYIVTESVFSMDGDTPNIKELVDFSKKHHAFLIVDEAHALGVFGTNGCGIVQALGLEKDVFARIVTFGKGLGCHGAVVLGSNVLKQYLINFARSFIYTTALSPHALATILTAYHELINAPHTQTTLYNNIQFFKQQITTLKIPIFNTDKLEEHSFGFIESNSAIHCCIISGNEKALLAANSLQKSNFGVKPIFSPTVPKGKERLRFCLHADNSFEEITEVLNNLANIYYE